ncbi:hypothetical protein E4U54_000283 [Claviceps lovelessii]|nr:hypothetical protein E4U54_000283 [Claviceps lovelessii]
MATREYENSTGPAEDVTWKMALIGKAESLVWKEDAHPLIDVRCCYSAFSAFVREGVYACRDKQFTAHQEPPPLRKCRLHDDTIRLSIKTTLCITVDTTAKTFSQSVVRKGGRLDGNAAAQATLFSYAMIGFDLLALADLSRSII